MSVYRVVGLLVLVLGGLGAAVTAWPRASVPTEATAASALPHTPITQLTHDPVSALRPAWSPDSQWLAFTGGDGRSIWLMRRDGSEARPIVSDGETNHFPWFLADGRLAFITEYVPPQYGGAWTNAWAYDLETGQRSLLHEFMSMQGPVDWSTDHSKLVFSSPRNGHFDIYLIDLNVAGGLEALRGSRTPTSVTAAQ